MMKPEIDKPSVAESKMKNAYQAFLDSSAKFITIAEFYCDKQNEGQPLSSNFQEKYTYNYQKLKAKTPDDFEKEIASFTLLLLDFTIDIKENLEEYQKMLADGPDKDASEYDQACDYLAIRDSFIDLKESLDDVSKAMIRYRVAETNENDPEYDYNAKIIEENKFKN